MPLQIRRQKIPASVQDVLRAVSIAERGGELLSPTEIFALAEYYRTHCVGLEQEGPFFERLFSSEIRTTLERVNTERLPFDQRIFELICSSIAQGKMQENLLEVLKWLQSHQSIRDAMLELMVKASQANQLQDYFLVLQQLQNAHIVFSHGNLAKLDFYIMNGQLHNLLDRLRESDNHKFIFLHQLGIKIICSDPKLPIAGLRQWMHILDTGAGHAFKRKKQYPLEAPFARRIADVLDQEITALPDSTDNSQCQQAFEQLFAELTRAGIRSPALYLALDKCRYDLDVEQLAAVLIRLKEKNLGVLVPISGQQAKQLWERYSAPVEEVGRAEALSLVQTTFGSGYFADQVADVLLQSSSLSEFSNGLQVPLHDSHRRVIDVAKQGQLFQFSPIFDYLVKEYDVDLSVVRSFLRNYCGGEYCAPDYVCPTARPLVALTDPRRKGGNPRLDRLSRLLPPTLTTLKEYQAERRLLDVYKGAHPNPAAEVFYSRHSESSWLLDERIKSILRQNPEMIRQLIEKPDALALIDAVSVGSHYPDLATIQKILNFRAETIVYFQSIIMAAQQKVPEQSRESLRMLSLWRLSTHWDSKSFEVQRSQLKTLLNIMLLKRNEAQQLHQNLSEFSVTIEQVTGQLRSSSLADTARRMIEINLASLLAGQQNEQKKLQLLENVELPAIELRLLSLEQSLVGCLEEEGAARRQLTLQWLAGSLDSLDMTTLTQDQDVFPEFHRKDQNVLKDLVQSQLTQQGFAVTTGLTDEVMKQRIMEQSRAQLATNGLTEQQFKIQLTSAGVANSQLADSAISHEEIMRFTQQRAMSSVKFYDLLLRQEDIVNRPSLLTLLQPFNYWDPQSLEKLVSFPEEILHNFCTLLQHVARKRSQSDPRVHEDMRGCCAALMKLSEDETNILAGVAGDPTSFPRVSITQAVLESRDFYLLLTAEGTAEPFRSLFLLLQRENITLTLDLYQKIMRIQGGQVERLNSILGVIKGGELVQALIRNYCGYDDDRLQRLARYYATPDLGFDGLQRKLLLTDPGFFELVKRLEGMPHCSISQTLLSLEVDRGELYGQFNGILSGVMAKQNPPQQAVSENELMSATICFNELHPKKGQDFLQLKFMQEDLLKIGRFYQTGFCCIASEVFGKMRIISERQAYVFPVLIECMSGFFVASRPRGADVNSGKIAKSFLESQQGKEFKAFVRLDKLWTAYEKRLTKKVTKKTDEKERSETQAKLDATKALLVKLHAPGTLSEKIANFGGQLVSYKDNGVFKPHRDCLLKRIFVRTLYLFSVLGIGHFLLKALDSAPTVCGTRGQSNIEESEKLVGFFGPKQRTPLAVGSPLAPPIGSLNAPNSRSPSPVS
ncbi:MAG: hypothetical protein A2X77_06345 [Gammaproteobacteria bacterium GWE2_42_36]|nr:MAG: hypothetical protein A2X77_06345 [Gammaproteobacteria bacterium GWE2_42_36]HCU05278.1 hypothetical protein [Coxiellaceae bacterium]